jgi:tRNA pseudouridine-54 N-methylase
LKEKDLRPPDTVNPNKPGSYSKSEKKSFRAARKHREAMIRRIYRSLNDTGERSDGAPDGFILHTNDSLQERLRLWKSEGGVTNTFMMDELGDPLVNVLASRNNKHEHHSSSDISTSTAIILGDQMGYSACDESTLAENDDVTKVSLGPISLLTSQCITITHNLLDIQSAVDA